MESGAVETVANKEETEKIEGSVEVDGEMLECLLKLGASEEECSIMELGAGERVANEEETEKAEGNVEVDGEMHEILLKLGASQEGWYVAKAPVAKPDWKNPKSAALVLIHWLLTTVLRKYNPAIVDRVPGLLAKYRHSEGLLLRTALLKHIAGMPCPVRASGGAGMSVGTASVDPSKQEEIYEEVLQELHEATSDRRVPFAPPRWPRKLSAEKRADLFLRLAWAIHGGQARASGFARLSLDSRSHAGGKRLQDIVKIWGKKYRRLLTSCASGSVSTIDVAAPITSAQETSDRTAAAVAVAAAAAPAQPATISDISNWIAQFE